MLQKDIFSRRWNLMLVFPPHFDINGSYIKYCLKKSKKESENLCKIVDSRNYPASVIKITDAGIVFVFLIYLSIYLFVYLFIYPSIHIWVCKLILYLSLKKAKSCGFCI